MAEINLFPKFMDNALSPVATSVGNTLSSVWNIVFGGIDSYSQKLDEKRMFNLNQFKQELEEKVSSVPKEKLVEPPLYVIGPSLEASKFYFDSCDLRNMFANLITASINSDTIDKAHPSFVEIIKQLTPDEAKLLAFLKEGSFPLINIHATSNNGVVTYIMKNFTNIDQKALGKSGSPILSYLENLKRLGLISIHTNSFLHGHAEYEVLENHPVTIHAIKLGEEVGKPKITRGYFTVTPFGMRFYQTCVK